MPIEIALTLNVNVPQLAEPLGRLLKLGESIMTALDDLTTKIDQLTALNAEQASKIEALTAEVNEGNDKTDALISVAAQTKDALEAARAELAGLNDARLAPLIAKIDGAIGDANRGIAAAQAGIVAANEQDVETDAARAAVAP